MQVAILSARTGWHTDELCRALPSAGTRGHRRCPTSGSSARLAACATATSRVQPGPSTLTPRSVAPRRGRGAGAHHSRRLARADHLSRRRAALDRGARRPRDELAARHRALGGQVLHDGAAAGGRRCRRRKRSSAKRADEAMAAVRARWATSSSSRSSARWAMGWCASAIPMLRFRVVRSLDADAIGVLRAARDRSRRARRARVRGRRPRAGGDRAAGRAATNGAPTCRAAAMARPIDLPPEWEHCWPFARRRPSAPTMRASTCCQRRRRRFRARGQRHSRVAGLQQATGVDVAGAIVDHLASRVSGSDVAVRRSCRREPDADPDARAARAARSTPRDRDGRQLACLLEVSAPKPGNVSPGRRFADMRVRGFPRQCRRRSAAAARRPDAAAGRRRFVLAIEATAALDPREHESRHRPAAGAAGAGGHRRHGCACRRRCDPGLGPAGCCVDALRPVLGATTTVGCARCLRGDPAARPGWPRPRGGAGRRREPTMPLLEAMRLAADRDGIAREYATGFESTFEAGVAGAARRPEHGRASTGTTRSSRRF